MVVCHFAQSKASVTLTDAVRHLGYNPSQLITFLTTSHFSRPEGFSNFV